MIGREESEEVIYSPSQSKGKRVKGRRGFVLVLCFCFQVFMHFIMLVVNKCLTVMSMGRNTHVLYLVI